MQHARLTSHWRGWKRLAPSTATLAPIGLLALAVGPVLAAQPPADPRLTATLVGRLEPGTASRFAVRWDGPDGAFLDAWIDLDGDGVLTPPEMVVQDRPLTPGIEVVSFELAPDVQLAADPRVWVRARDGRPCDAWATTGLGTTGRSRDPCAWQPGFMLDLNGWVGGMTVYDDGSGPALYVGGQFTAARGVTVNHIARWDGSEWSALRGPSGIGVDGFDVSALTVFDDGSGPALYVGGYFTTAGGVTVNNIARWNGSEWSALSGPGGTGVGGPPSMESVDALAVFDDGSGPALYAGGEFWTAGGVTVNRVARWDGAEWSALIGPSGTGVDEFRVAALAVFDDGSGPALYAGGDFHTAGGVTVNNIARWDGSEWSDLSGPGGTGVGGDFPSVMALAVFDDGSGRALYAGGDFTTAGGVTVNNIARWDGAEWSDLSGPGGTGVGGDNPLALVALAVFDDGTGPALYAGGRFTTAGGVVVNNIARWDGSEWSDLSGPGGPGVGGGSVPTAPYVSGLAVFDDGSGPALYAGGDFTIAGGVTVNNIARWEGTEWSGTSGDAGVDGDVRSLAVFDDGSGPALYAGGDFTTAGGVTANHIARWDGSEWSALSGPGGTGVGGGYYDPDVRALTVFDDGTGSALYAGGDFTTAGGVTVNSVARWDGTEWSALSGASGTGASGIVHALAVFDDGSGPALYIGGMFSTAGGLYVNNIASWDGSEWSDLSGLSWPGADGPVFALATSDDGSGPALHVGGQFTTAGGVTVNNIARWDGSEWSDLSGPSGTGADSIVRALAAFDDGSGPALYAGGGFETAGGVTVNNIARWNGSEWSALSGPSGTGVSDWVSALTVFDDGSGPALYAGGWFEIAGGVTVNNIARWNGSEWSDLNGGVHGHVAALATFDHGLGPTLYTNLATWHCSSAIFADGFESGTIAAWSRTVP